MVEFAMPIVSVKGTGAVRYPRNLHEAEALRLEASSILARAGRLLGPSGETDVINGPLIDVLLGAVTERHAVLKQFYDTYRGGVR